jgi:hypothetical protein
MEKLSGYELSKLRIFADFHTDELSKAPNSRNPLTVQKIFHLTQPQFKSHSDIAKPRVLYFLQSSTKMKTVQSAPEQVIHDYNFLR